jgi:ribosomal protein S18 acetylase RimI-like enzyme
MKNKVGLRSLKASDLPELAAIHDSAFPNAVLTKLGSRVVQKYYEWQMRGPHEVYTCGAFLDGKCVGFYIGGRFRGATSGFLRHNKWFLIRHLVIHPWLMANPMVRARIRFSRQVLVKSARANGRGARSEKKEFALLAIAVDPECQGLGIGTLIMQEAEDAARSNGFSAMSLFVKPENTKAVEFYENLNWTRCSRNSKWIGNMRKPLIA